MPQKILAVDDQPHMLVLLERIIREETKYECISTNNPLEVPGILVEESYDVIITDLKMPGMDGLEILEYISQNNRRERSSSLPPSGSWKPPSRPCSWARSTT